MVRMSLLPVYKIGSFSMYEVWLSNIATELIHNYEMYEFSQRNSVCVLHILMYCHANSSNSSKSVFHFYHALQLWPGEVAYPDFTHPKAEEFWTRQLAQFHKIVPFDGLWIVRDVF